MAFVYLNKLCSVQSTMSVLEFDELLFFIFLCVLAFQTQKIILLLLFIVLVTYVFIVQAVSYILTAALHNGSVTHWERTKRTLLAVHGMHSLLLLFSNILFSFQWHIKYIL